MFGLVLFDGEVQQKHYIKFPVRFVHLCLLSVWFVCVNMEFKKVSKLVLIAFSMMMMGPMVSSYDWSASPFSFFHFWEQGFSSTLSLSFVEVFVKTFVLLVFGMVCEWWLWTSFTSSQTSVVVVMLWFLADSSHSQYHRGPQSTRFLLLLGIVFKWPSYYYYSWNFLLLLFAFVPK